MRRQPKARQAKSRSREVSLSSVPMLDARFAGAINPRAACWCWLRLTQALLPACLTAQLIQLKMS